MDAPIQAYWSIPSDIVKLSAGSALPADCLALEARDLHVDEATLIGDNALVAASIRQQVVFGPISSIFDYFIFGVLFLMFWVGLAEFRAGWFVELVVSAALVVLVIRVRRPFFRSRPGVYLGWATLAVVAFTLLLPFTPLAGVFGFTSLPLRFMMLMMLLVALYLVSVEVAKRIFYRWSGQAGDVGAIGR